MNVEIKDRQLEVESLRMALNMCELYVSYPQAELIIQTMDKMKKEGDQFNISDALTIHSNWKNKWDEYFKNLETKKNE